MLFALFSLVAPLLFATNNASPYFMPELREEIIRIVDDPVRKIEVLRRLDDYEADFAVYQKSFEDREQILRNLNLDRNATMDELKPLFVDGEDSRRALMRSYLQHRKEILEILTDKEWNALVDAGIDYSLAKEDHKSADEIRQMLSEYDHMEDIERAIERRIKDADRQMKVRKAYDAFLDELATLLEEAQSFNFDHIAALKKYNPSIEELHEFSDRQHDFRENVFQLFLHLRRDVREATTKKEWKRVARQLNQLL